MRGSPDENASALEDVNFLSSSRNRIAILNAFDEADALTRREVREAVDASRSTVRRTLEGFVERDLIESTDGGYRFTSRGAVVVDALGDLLETVRITEEYRPLFRWGPVSRLDFDPAWLAGGSMTVSTETDPYAPAQRQTETVRDADVFRGVLPAIEREGAELVRDRVVDGDLTARVLVPEGMLPTIRSDPFEDLFRDKLATADFDLFVHEGPLEYYFGLADAETVELGGMDADGIPRVLFRSDRAELREWGDEHFARLVDEAESVDAEDV